MRAGTSHREFSGGRRCPRNSQWFPSSPSLLPRGPLFQGVVTGAAAAFGYGLGLLAAAIIRWMLHR
ncbi:hypothetical protein GV789_29085, partial [Nocardia cyriacigeorgica]